MNRYNLETLEDYPYNLEELYPEEYPPIKIKYIRGRPGKSIKSYKNSGKLLKNNIINPHKHKLKNMININDKIVISKYFTIIDLGHLFIGFSPEVPHLTILWCWDYYLPNKRKKWWFIKITKKEVIVDTYWHI